MDYEKKYREAFEKAEECHTDGLSLHQPVKDVIEYIFPELKESEDERIRKNMISYFKQINYDNAHTWEGINLNKFVAWLEKQGEQNLADKVEPKFNIGDIIFNKKTKEQFIITDRSLTLQYYHDEDHLHEVRFSEQDDWEIIKPKFHEGEWITNGATNPAQISSIKDGMYFTHNDTIGGDIESIDKEYHLWAIQDAKDGDVLIYNHQPFKWIFIFKCLYNPILVSYYVMFTEKNKICIDDSISTNFLSKITPASEEQRNLLFTKMKEAGYEWDEKNKELKKVDEIEEPDFFDDFRNSDVEVDSNEDGLIAATIKYKNEQKQAWSEEDENVLEDIEEAIINYWHGDTQDILLDWLKSLKERMKGE